MHGRLLLPTATWLALLAPAAWAQSPQTPGKSPPDLPPQPQVARLFGVPQPAPVTRYYAQTTHQPRTIVWGPGPAGRTLAWVGRRMQWFGQQHTWVIHHDVVKPVTPTPAPQPVAPVQPVVPPLVPLPSSQQAARDEDVPPFAMPPRAARAEEVPPAAGTIPRLVPELGNVSVLPEVR